MDVYFVGDFLFIGCQLVLLKALNYLELFRRIDSTLQPTEDFVETMETENKTDETKSFQIEQLKSFMIETNVGNTFNRSTPHQPYAA